MDLGACPTNLELAQLVRGEFPKALAAALADHVQGCSSCSQALEEIVANAPTNTVAFPQLDPAAADAQVFLTPAAEREEIGRLAHYRILKKLGEGGMGMVLLAEDTQLERPVALKVIKPDIAKNDEARQRFLREARAMAQVRSDHVVTVYHVGQVGDVCYIAMEFLEGESLETWLEKVGRPPLGETLRIGREIALALAAAQARGMIHRDIKPANVWLEAPARRVKVLDFGLARPQTADVKLTTTGAVMGTPAYMAPEQAFGEPLDGRADLYSLGGVLYEMVTGRLPFEAPTALGLLRALTTQTPQPARGHNTEVPQALDDLIMRLLAKQPDDRPEPAQVVVAELQAIERQLLVPVTGTVVQVCPPAAVTSAVSGGDLVWSRSRPTPSPSQTPAPSSSTPRSPRAPLATPMPAGEVDLSNREEIHPSDPAGKTVLLVDPSRSQTVIIRGYLEKLGLQTIATVPSGAAAMEAAINAPPGVVISAMYLADMTGTELAQKMRAQPALAAVAFILITSQADEEEGILAGHAGTVVRLPRPFGQAELAHALAAAIAKPSQQIPSPASDPRERLRVLIVDDSALERLHIRRVLKGLGLAQFVETTDGARAVAAVAGESFDLIVTDRNMPHMDGRELVAYLRQDPSTASVPIIMVTTEQDPGKLEAMRRLGVTAVCDKSFQPEVVGKIIGQLVSRIPTDSASPPRGTIK
jgi:serine/threonine protein kinase/DNA-binding response OmpR family regulator